MTDISSIFTPKHQTMNQTIEYALISDRIKAMIVDSIILIIAMYLSSFLLGQFEEVPDAVRITIFVALFLLYEPLFVSQFGGSIGHTFFDLTVRKEADLQKKIGFPAAVLRFVIKTLLGWLSLLTVSSNEKKKAIHDWAVASVIVVEA